MKQETKIRIGIAIVIVVILGISVAANAQNKYISAKRMTWRKTALTIGASLASITLEMCGDALYDMGKESGNKSQMQWGHTLQATGYVVPLVAIPFLVKGLTAGLDPLYAGVTTEHDNFMSTIPPHGRAFMKTIVFTLGFSININYW